MLHALATAIRLLVSLVFLGLVGAGAWFGYDYVTEHNRELRERDERLAQQELTIGRLEHQVASQQQEIERLDLALRLLKVDRRLAQVVVTGQDGSREEGTLRTRFKFLEVDETGEPVSVSRTFEIEGDRLYVDAWVIKFDDELVEQGDPLRSASLCLFRRLFGEHQEPSQGAVLDNPYERPEVYGGDQEMSGFERELWRDFWEIANDPERAAEIGVRAAHGEAPNIQLREGKVYEIALRASGGLTITPRPQPAVMTGD